MISHEPLRKMTEQGREDQEDRDGCQQKVGKDKDKTLNWLCEQGG